MDGRLSSPAPRTAMGYELLDVGDGRRLERFGALVVDRPSPVAVPTPARPEAWSGADLVYERRARVVRGARRDRGPGGWAGPARAAAPWTVEVDGLTLELRPTPAGQVGLFPEQLPMLGWLGSRLHGEVRARPDASTAAPVVLNLYAYTGAVTLACARAGARVVHVDASRPAVAWARRNAELSGLAEAPVRWIVDDARAFVEREGRRGRRYQGLVLDPPSYGHGPRGGDWRLERDLPELLSTCARTLSQDARFVLLTAHTPGHGPEVLTDALGEALGRRCEGGWLEIVASSGAVLRLGAYARWSTR